MALLDKLKKALKAAFHDPLFPEPEVQEVMAKQGWKFEFNYFASPHGFAVGMHTEVKTPDGKPALGEGRDEEAFQTYVSTLEQTRKTLGISQP